VFLTSPGESDNIFRKSEPAAHDDWHPEKLGLPPGRANPVRVAFNQIREYFRNQATSETEAPSGSAAGELARMFGSELSGSGTWGPSSPESSGGSGGTRGVVKKAFTLVDVDEPRVLKREENSVFIEFKFQISGEFPDDHQATPVFETYILNADGQVENSPPIGEDVPEITEVRALPSNERTLDKALFTKENMPLGFSVIVKGPSNALIGCSSKFELSLTRSKDA
jgi:hypothetical protein